MTNEQLEYLNKISLEADKIEMFLDYINKNPLANRSWLEATKNRLKKAHWAYGAFSAQYQLAPDDEEALCNHLINKAKRLREEISSFGCGIEGEITKIIEKEVISTLKNLDK